MPYVLLLSLFIVGYGVFLPITKIVSATLLITRNKKQKLKIEETERTHTVTIDELSTYKHTADSNIKADRKKRNVNLGILFLSIIALVVVHTLL